MTEKQSIALHKQAHSAAHTGDIETLAAMIAEDVVWHSPGRNQVSGNYYGREAVLSEFFGTMAQESEGTAGFRDFQNTKYFGSDDYSVALFRWGATRRGKSATYNVFEVIRWDNDQIAEEWAYYDDMYLVDEFWS